MDLDDIATLDAVARVGSISGAAKRRGVSVSTVARRLDALEASLGLRLVDRRANGALLTPHGDRIVALAEPMLAAAARIERGAAALRQGAGETLVRVSATGFIVSEDLAPALPRLWAAHPGLVVQLQAQGEVVSLANRDADLAVRMSRPDGNSLLARALPDIRLGLFIDRALLGARDPAAVDPGTGRLLVYDDSYGRLPELDWIDRRGWGAAVALRTGSTRALLTATLAGAGVGLLPARHAARHATLVEIPLADPPAPRRPWLIVHRDVRRLPAVAAVHRWIVDAFTRI